MKIKCLMCDTILESNDKHDFYQCSCQNKTFILYEKDYLRYGGFDFEFIEVLDDDSDL